MHTGKTTFLTHDTCHVILITRRRFIDPIIFDGTTNFTIELKITLVKMLSILNNRYVLDNMFEIIRFNF